MAAENTTEVKSEKKSSLISIKKEKPDLRKIEQPLVDVKVTNPITYLKSWWRKVIGNEGMEIKIKLRPLTAIAITIIIVTVTFGIGKFVLPFKLPFFEYNLREGQQVEAQQPVLRESGFVGELKKTFLTGKYYLITSSSETINLQVPANIDLSDLVGERILATGKYNESNRLLTVEDASGLEVLPEEIESVPTIESTPSPIPTQPPTATPETPEQLEL
jgi:hypothetical protein